MRGVSTHRALSRWLWLSRLGSVAEQAVLSSDDEWPDRTFGSVDVDQLVAFLTVPPQFFTVVCQIADGFAQGVLRLHLQLHLLIQLFN
jgi:hypothetical protein